MNALGDSAPTIGATLALIGAFVAWVRWVRPRWNGFWHKAGGVSEAILGREAIYDKNTGTELVPALPGIGVRLAHQEQQMELLAVTVTKLVDQQIHQQALAKRVDGIEERTKVLEDAVLERTASHNESAQMLKTMDTAMKSNPKHDA